MHVGRGRIKQAIRTIVYTRLTINGTSIFFESPLHTNEAVSSSLRPLDKITLISSTGLLESLVPGAESLQAFNAATNLKLGPIPKPDRLKEQVARTLADADAAAERERAGSSGVNGDLAHVNGDSGDHPNFQANGHGEDVEMNGDINAHAGPSSTAQPAIPEDVVDPTLISPELDETIPPVPQMFTIAELSREVEAIRDKRRMIRLGPNVPRSNGLQTPPAVAPATVLPSVVAYTVFDGGEG